MKVSLPMTQGAMHSDSAFSYLCNACGRCCYHKRIQTNPYEVLRLARNRGLSTGQFMRRYLEAEGPYLRVTDEAACVFLSDKACTVHADRPLACRTYPLGRWVSAEGEESFRLLDPHPQTEGSYGRDGTVAEFLKAQGAQPYMEAADKYQAMFYRLFDAVQQILPTATGLASEAQAALFAADETGRPRYMEWLDVDSMAESYCAEHRRAVPRDLDEVLSLHVLAIDQWLSKRTGDKP